jgi:hypothetical protein
MNYYCACPIRNTRLIGVLLARMNHGPVRQFASFARTMGWLPFSHVSDPKRSILDRSRVIHADPLTRLDTTAPYPRSVRLRAADGGQDTTDWYGIEKTDGKRLNNMMRCRISVYKMSAYCSTMHYFVRSDHL